jgi:FixJ family two-component response regulator
VIFSETSEGHQVGIGMRACEQNTRLFLLDDNDPHRDSLVELLAASGIQVETCDSFEEFLDRVELSEGGCILLDVCLPNECPLKLHRSLKSFSAIWPIIHLCQCADIHVAVEAMKLGAVDFLTKPVHNQLLLDTLNRAMTIGASNFKSLQERNNLHNRLRLLTSRELQVLDLLVRGWPNKQIAAYLEVSLRTIEFRRAAIQKKLRLKSIVEIIWQIGRCDFEITGLPIPMYERSHRMSSLHFPASLPPADAKVKYLFNGNLSVIPTNRQTESIAGGDEIDRAQLPSPISIFGR